MVGREIVGGADKTSVGEDMEKWKCYILLVRMSSDVVDTESIRVSSSKLKQVPYDPAIQS